MAKRVDPLKAKAAKQKKIAIGLSVMFLAVLGFQGPKILKMVKPPAPPVTTAAPAAAPAPTPSAGTPVVPVATDGAAPSTPSAQPAVLANSDLPITAGEGQLLSFERFTSKDPFQQQAEAAPEVVDNDDPPVTIDSSPSSDPAPAGSDPAIPGSAENPPLSIGGLTGGGSDSSGSPANPIPITPTPAVATATTISVNGTVATVAVGAPFPADQPTFELVSLAQDGKSVQIGVAGGSLVGGGKTVKLTVGKALTLQNTADGSRYKLELLTVEGAVLPASKG